MVGKAGDRLTIVDITREDAKDIEIEYLQGRIRKLENENSVLREYHGIANRPEPYVRGYLLGISAERYQRKGRK